MTPAPAITVTLDRPRAIRWTMRAQARNASLARPASFAMLGKRRHALYAMAALLWAALVDRDHEFEAPEDIAEFLASDQQQIAALEAITAMVREAFPEKKSQPSESSSPSGPAVSSKSDSAPAHSTTGS